MSRPRLAALPIDHLEAELVAFPIASEAALRSCTIELDPMLGTGNSTWKLWRAAENELIGAWPAVGLDEGVAIRDRLWYSEPDPLSPNPKILPLGTFLKRLANRALESKGSTARPRIQLEASEAPPFDIESRARSVWRWLSFALPADLLLSGLAKDGRVPHSVSLLDPSLGQILADRGFAEAHLHVGAALDFGQLWVATLQIIGDPSSGVQSFESAGACFDEGRSLGAWLLRAALTRYFLAAFLKSGTSNLREFFSEQEKRLLDAFGGVRASALAAGFTELRAGQLFGTIDPKTHHATLRGVYRQLVGTKTSLPDFPDELWHEDPIATLVPWSVSRGTTPEIGFVVAALEFLQKHPKDRLFAELFWQTIRIRCLYYRHVVLRPLTPGLQWFLRAFDRMRHGRRRIGYRLAIESALKLCDHANGLRSLEVRTSPERSFGELTTLINALNSEPRQKSNSHPSSQLLSEYYRRRDLKVKKPSWLPEIGLVLHFPRERGEKWQKGRPSAFWSDSHSNPGLNANAGFRYAHYYRRQRRLARTLARFLTSHPSSLNLIRGLDLCSDELAVPTWVLAPLLRHARDAGLAASTVLKSCFGKNVPELRSTVHVGEDFIHLMTGLRNIDQAIERFELRSGDRLGHALALGIEPRQWAERAGRVAIPREDRLSDLFWEWTWWSMYGGAGGMAGGRLLTLERQIHSHSERIFGRRCHIDELKSLDDYLHNELQLKALGFPNGGAVEQQDDRRQATVDDLIGSPQRRSLSHVDSLMMAYLTSPDVFRKGREIIRVDPLPEIETLIALQQGLRNKVAQKCLTIEVNPSSNLLVGHLGELQSHPLWRLRPPSGAEMASGLPICIGSDDPLTFSTRLPEEFQHLHDALILAKFSQAEALAWLDTVRQTGFDTRFTLPREEKLSIQPWLLGMCPPIALPP